MPMAAATRADEHEAVGRQAPALPASGEQAGEDDRSGSLDVVVEARLPVPVAVEDAHRVVLLEVLPLDDGRREDPGHGLDERLDDRVVRRAAQPRRPVTDVERIVQELAAVGPDIERDGQGVSRIDARGRGVQGQLPHRDRHPAGSLVAKAQDALVVGDDDQADVVAGRAKDGVDPADVVRGDPDAARTPDDVAELLAGKADGRRVDDRQELLEVLDEEPVEQGLVAVLEGGQPDVPLEVVGLAPDVLELQGDLLVDRRHARRQQTVQAEGVALAGREGRALVEERMRHQLVPAAVERETRRNSVKDAALERAPWRWSPPTPSRRRHDVGHEPADPTVSQDRAASPSGRVIGTVAAGELTCSFTCCRYGLVRRRPLSGESVRGEVGVTDDPHQCAAVVDHRKTCDKGRAEQVVGFLEGRLT